MLGSNISALITACTGADAESWEIDCLSASRVAILNAASIALIDFRKHCERKDELDRYTERIGTYIYMNAERSIRISLDLHISQH